MSKEFFEYNIEQMKAKYPIFSCYQDYHIFTLFCIKYFYFTEMNIPFDADAVIEYLTDGANDGGIDAIFNDPTSEKNDLIIIQSKYYNNTELKATDVVGELYKINETLNKLRSNKISNFNSKLVSAYRNATSQMDDDAQVKIVFFTSFDPKNKRTKNSLTTKLSNYFKDYELELNFKSDIMAQIDICDNGKLFVDLDKIEIDRKDNFLEYEDSVIVNISALSLQDLYIRRRNGLLGMNLRYYVKKKSVDEGIRKTIEQEPENFWYKNNGIVIICQDFTIDGREIWLKQFSIINGGQTTNRIGRLDIHTDFYLQCKVVKLKGIRTKENDEFTLSIAESTNSQKPIKESDLRANSSEQLRLKERLKRCNVFYTTKKGDSIPSQYSEPYQSAKMEQVGKLCLAAVLQMPGSARSSSQKMYTNKDLYYSIYGDSAKEEVIADLLKISYYYDVFKKTYIKNRGFDDKVQLPMMKNGKTFIFACLTLLCKLNYGVFDYSEITRYNNDIDSLKMVIRNMDGMERIITSRLDDEENIFMEIFTDISTEVLSYCYRDAQYRASRENKTIVPSDFLKKDSNYYKEIISRLWMIYNNNLRLKKNIDLICGK